MKAYLEISISSNEAQRELLIPTMMELGCEGFQETDTALLCYLEQSRWNEAKHEMLRAQIKRLLQNISVNAAIQFREFSDENWNAQWEQSLQPIEIGNKLVIKPSWCIYARRENRVIIEIDPKMSFGTGYHETTRLTLCLLEKYARAGINVLDVGTGTGILAIASVKLGASSATGIDMDEWSIENATENVIRNNVENQVTISPMPLIEFSPLSFDLVCANLTLNTNLSFLSEFKRILVPNGVLLLSGLLNQDRDQMIHGLIGSEFTVIEEITENEWVALAAKLTS